MASLFYHSQTRKAQDASQMLDGSTSSKKARAQNSTFAMLTTNTGCGLCTLGLGPWSSPGAMRVQSSRGQRQTPPRQHATRDGALNQMNLQVYDGLCKFWELGCLELRNYTAFLAPSKCGRHICFVSRRQFPTRSNSEDGSDADLLTGSKSAQPFVRDRALR